MHNLLFQGQSFIVQFTCIGLLALLGIAILSRNILRFDLVKGTEELLSLMSAWLYFIGGSIASYEDSHISADLISVRFLIHDTPPKHRFSLGFLCI
jgi:TRAP-type C4-dicarboxylate transport system permease small subunit